LNGADISQGLVWPNAIIHPMGPLLERWPELFKHQVSVIAVPEFLFARPVQSLYRPIQLGRSGRQAEKQDAHFFARLLKLCAKFAASIHLNGPYLERGYTHQLLQEFSRKRSRGCGPYIGVCPLGHDIFSRKLLVYGTRLRPHILGINLDRFLTVFLDLTFLTGSLRTPRLFR